MTLKEALAIGETNAEAERVKKLIDEINRKAPPLPPPSPVPPDIFVALDAILENTTGGYIPPNRNKNSFAQTKADFMLSLQNSDSPAHTTREEFIKAMANPTFLPGREDILRHFSNDTPNGMLQHQFLTMCFNEVNPLFDLYTAEYIGALAHYIYERCLGRPNPTAPIILEVGAGTGRLTHFLSKAIPGFHFVATDDLSYGIPTDACTVLAHDHQNALNEYQPEIVISAWMPYRKDWTATFRACPSVKEYILIGETDYGCCGDPWLTWGYSEEDDPTFTRVAPYKTDGFTRHNLTNISMMQICRTDFLCYDSPTHSRTVSFRRK